MQATIESQRLQGAAIATNRISNRATGRITNALTVDVEDYFHVAALAASIHPDSWDSRESRVVRNTRVLLELFREFDVQATFFVLGWVAERERQLIRDIAGAGHEVACHGYSHQLVYKQSPAEFREETIRSKKLLEDITGSAVLGYRAASYSIVRESLWATDILAELGFAYDSSIFPVHHDRYGIPDAERKPNRMTTPTGQSIVEWPLATAGVMGFRLPVAGGGYFRLLPYRLIQWGLASINSKERQPFIFYLHPWEIDPGQPRVSASRLSTFRHYTNLDKCEGRLRQLLQDFDFGTARDCLINMGLLPGLRQAAAA
ncbi:MAG TPA: XrtA system polysaccharide deacetylase [Burkholderiales bacterium]|nr:XrtA system polysaccharide deacetylase [Burkholderiales bacterium]